MKKYKIYVCILVLFLFCYWLFNLLTWKLFTEHLLYNPNCVGGDLSRLGYITDIKMCRQNQIDLPIKHIELDQFKGERIDLITIGDSFSSGGGGGKNSYYQDYIASLKNMTVLNIPQYKKLDKITTISVLNNNGFIDKVKPRFVLIEFAEKLCFTDFPDNINFNEFISEKNLKSYERYDYAQKTDTSENKAMKLSFFSDANYKLVKNKICYNFSENAYNSKVYRTVLNKHFFSVNIPNILLFFHSDIKYRDKYTVKNIVKLNSYLNTLSDRLASKGIKLYFMPCVDKYNLYSKYIVSNKYPESTFFEELRKLPKSYNFIDTKALLREELEKGVQDLYYADDTHWSWKASEKIFKTVSFQ